MNAVNYRFPQGYNKHKMYSMSYKKNGLSIKVKK